jgi:hypothetical protein
MGELRSTISDDALDRQLRDALPYVDDSGFTARVLSRLPVQRHANQSLRSAILIGLTLLGSALAYILSDSGRFIVVNLVKLSNLSPLLVITLTVAVGVLAVSGALVTAVAKLREARP